MNYVIPYISFTGLNYSSVSPNVLFIIIDKGLLVAKIESYIPRAVWQGGQ